LGWSACRKSGLTYHDPRQSEKGYTLVTPGGGDSTYLSDMEGRVVRRWRYAGYYPDYARVNGRLITTIFRAHRYGADFPGLASRRLDPEAWSDLNRLHGLA
jgi:hypothetical protein